MSLNYSLSLCRFIR